MKTTKEWIVQHRGQLHVLFCGGRGYDNTDKALEVMDFVLPAFVCTGGARGADSICSLMARKRGIPQVIYPANWSGEEGAAGPMRNERMLRMFCPHLVVAFPGGSGTAHMYRIAKEETRVIKVGS